MCVCFRCKGSPECEACQSTLHMERVCSLSSPDSSLSTSSSTSQQSSTSPCKRPNRSVHKYITLKKMCFTCPYTIPDVQDFFSLVELTFNVQCFKVCIQMPLLSLHSMSDDERESGCDMVDGSPASVSSSRADSPFLQDTYIHDNSQNCKADGSAKTESIKLPVRTMVVPPMRVPKIEPLSCTGNHNTNPLKPKIINFYLFC